MPHSRIHLSDNGTGAGACCADYAMGAKVAVNGAPKNVEDVQAGETVILAGGTMMTVAVVQRIDLDDAFMETGRTVLSGALPE